MSKPDKPIFNQQGGRGKLYGPTHGATYMGTYQMPDGKMDRRMFNCATNKDAIKAYTDWCADMDARILEEMEEKVRPKAKAQQPKEKPAYTLRRDGGRRRGRRVVRVIRQGGGRLRRAHPRCEGKRFRRHLRCG